MKEFSMGGERFTLSDKDKTQSFEASEEDMGKVSNVKLYCCGPAWVIANNKEEAAEIVADEFDIIFTSLDDIEVVSEEDMDNLKYFPDVEDLSKHHSFREEFKRRDNTVGVFAYDLSEF